MRSAAFRVALHPANTLSRDLIDAGDDTDLVRGQAGIDGLRGGLDIDFFTSAERSGGEVKDFETGTDRILS
jgi:hypothetical protein